MKQLHEIFIEKRRPFAQDYIKESIKKLELKRGKHYILRKDGVYDLKQAGYDAIVTNFINILLKK